MSDGEHPFAPRHDGPDADGFHGWTFPGDGFASFVGRMATRVEGADVCRVRVETGPSRANVLGKIHGGFLLGFLDQALFVGPVSMDRLPFVSAVTLGVSTQFVGAGRIEEPLDCLVEIVRETRRLVFLRGTMEQGDHLVLTFQATLSKISKPVS
ncbi:PaaI family thioesterase [Sphingomonas abietis]|uniref:PaaI family thioesterase n=1 Tax=Sphingomonas abietis TaxID=3012344 RepID=A0ABY7NPT0_9SPHN|nr:PaaI family thioesterase [Sphingomonas abietis]WBO23544.1 PaaI family thioesterase [Sphingomonas abietis]